ncbi:MAG TPA: glycosyltransferase [Micropepsaceae bacterium]|jgi:spore maturation protein CgeB|nr:glycosyltransferase [Micropepsaceae bacterium]
MSRIVFIGLTITSSWGNGHATTYRALIKALSRRGHQVTFLERDVPWYRDNRDFQRSRYCRVLLYRELDDLKKFAPLVRDADAVIVGSYVPDGIAVGEWVTATAQGITAFYDIDTPVTLKALEGRSCEYLNDNLIAAYDVYLSFTGGPALEHLRSLGSPCPAALYCSVDPEFHAPVATRNRWRLGYLGTYATDRQPALERMLLEPARALPNARFAVAGPQYPEDICWPDNVEYISHLPPERHPAFYCGQNFALNLTRADMRVLGFSPSVRLFEAASCGVPIISDPWDGLETVFKPDREILLAETAEDVLHHLDAITPAKRRAIAEAARARVLAAHTSHHRAQELETILRMASPKVAGAA